MRIHARECVNIYMLVHMHIHVPVSIHTIYIIYYSMCVTLVVSQFSIHERADANFPFVSVDMYVNCCVFSMRF